MKYTELAINDPDDLIFGKAPNPIKTRRGLNIGGGKVYPELNFTLPPMEVSLNTLSELQDQYRQITTGALDRAVDLQCEGLVLEFETLIEMTKTPEIGISLVSMMNDICEEYYQKHNLKSEIRLTPNDLREFDRPPRQQTSPYLEPMLQLFEEGAKTGGNLLSIESTGGKEISDDALMNCNFKKFVFSQAVLGVRDVSFLWEKIVAIAKKTGQLPGGDTACGFGNTAMVLAEKKYIPKVFAALARIATVVRTLASVEVGALGPDKDCGYEGPFLKAIAGIPISMEGKTAACAHLSPLGNIASACADLWSNESVQNIKLLAGMAPTVYMEQLIYDVRLMNEASKLGKESALHLQRLMINSDAYLDPQALILAPQNVIKISKEIVKGGNYVESTMNGCKTALNIIEEAIKSGQLILSAMELPWVELLKTEIESIPLTEDKFVNFILPELDQSKLILSEYGL